MKAFILAAGEGSRLQPLTGTLPKPMLPILNRPVLDYIVKHLVSCGVNDIMMNPGYLGNEIEKYFRDGQQFGCSIGYLPEFVMVDGGVSACMRGSASSLATAQYYYDFFNEPVLVLCADAIIDLDIQQVMKQHKNSGASVSVILQPVPIEQAHKYGIARLGKDNEIIEFVEKPSVPPAEPCIANTGIYIFEPNAIANISELSGMDIGADLIPAMVKSRDKVVGIVQEFNWYDIGTLEDYRAVNHQLNNAKMDTTAHQRLTPLFTENSSEGHSRENVALTLGNTCIIGSDVEFRGSVVVGNNCAIGQSCCIENSIIAPYCRVPANSYLNRVILTERWLVTFTEAGKVLQALELNNGDSRPLFQTATLVAEDKLRA